MVNELKATRYFMEGFADCTIVGRGRDTLDLALNKARDAMEVRNVFAPFSLSQRQIEYKKYWQNINLGKRQKLIQAVHEGGGIWKDICSPTGLMYEDFSLQDKLLELTVTRQARRDQAGSNGKEDRAPFYELHCLRESYPVLNFTIFKYTEEDREVLFGWGLHPNDNTGLVFSSRNPQVVSIFDKFWITLRADSVLVDSHKIAANREEITGEWVFGSYKDGVLVSVGILYIDFGSSSHRTGLRDRRTLTIKGRAHRIDDDGKPELLSGEIRTPSARLSDDNRNMWFALTHEIEKEDGSRVSWYGAGHCSFKNYKPLAPSASNKNDIRKIIQVPHAFEGEYLHGGGFRIKFSAKRLRSRADLLGYYGRYTEATITELEIDSYQVLLEYRKSNDNWPALVRL